MKIEHSVISGAKPGKLKENTSFELPIDVPSWAVKGPFKARRGNRWFFLGDDPQTNSFADLWPPRGIRPPVRSEKKLYLPAGLVVVETCQSLINGGYEITYRYSDGVLSRPQYSRVKRAPGWKGHFRKHKCNRLTLSVVSVEPLRRGKRVFWHVIYRIENINEQKAS